ncbi:hypothetical protein [Leptolyngbya sp. AN02str]|uniref:hypothetical protein n=1 Tax=Leptolyngbya sp. AN02str TaxID=3423363 RepID=UPI003D322301
MPQSAKRMKKRSRRPNAVRLMAQLAVVLVQKSVHQFPAQAIAQTLKTWRLPLLVMLALVVSGSVGAIGFTWLTSLPPLPECSKVSRQSSDSEQLFCVRDVARSGKLPDLLTAIELVSGWTDAHPLYAESQELLAGWSKAVLEIARKKYASSDLQGAVEVARNVPPSSPVYADAQDIITTWSAEWDEGEKILAIAQTAIQQQNWSLASEQIVELGKLANPYWRERRMAELTEQIVEEQDAWKVLLQARSLAASAEPLALASAIALVEQVNPKTHVWQEAQADVQTWGEQLANLGLQRWKTGDMEGAYELGRQVPSQVSLSDEAGDLVALSHAAKLAQWDPLLDWMPSFAQIVNLREAIAALDSIQPGSVFYPRAQSLRQNWQAQLQDLTQLQYAHAVATVGQRATFDWASASASLIGRERPRRIQAQTLIDHWRQETQRIEDMPLLARAYELAQPGSIVDIQAAIAAAQRVPQHRALWREAQNAIDVWVAQIQTIEDRPVLNRARQYAEQGNLNRAIREARLIEPNRALSTEAQSLLNTWQAELNRIRLAEDRKILDEAAALASRSRYTQAIGVASQLERDRPLYQEAQAAIAQWDAERTNLWQQWEPEPAAAPAAQPAPSVEPVEPANDAEGIPAESRVESGGNAELPARADL